MGPQNREASGIQPSLPSAEQVQPELTSDEILSKAAEQAVANAEMAQALQPPSGQVVSTAALPIPQTNVTAIALDDVSGTTPISALQADDDGDLIEKEWVNKAKQIVEQNRDNPYKQSEELTVFKANYMKKRYGKTVKISQ